MQLSIFVSLCFRKSFGLLNEYMTIWLLRNQVFLIFASPRPFSSELGQLGIIYPFPFRVVGSNGLGPSTSRLSGVCSNQLSYEPIMVEVIGFEPMTPCLQGRCSTS